MPKPETGIQRADRENFGKWLVIAGKLNLDLKEVIKYELSPVLLCICHCTLLEELEIDIALSSNIEKNPGETGFVIDTMTLIQMANSSKSKTFKKLTESLTLSIENTFKCEDDIFLNRINMT